jgi:RNA polymerase sigma factor (sigma-70 family)
MRSPLRSPPHEPSDADLLGAAHRGDAAALGLLLERHRPRLYATALRVVGYRPDAEDAVQETCLAALLHLGAVRDPHAVGAWLNAVLLRACLQQRRRDRVLLTDTFPDVADERASPELRVERLELRDWIWGALERLPETLRVTALLRYFGSYDSYDELAAILGVPIGTIRSRLSDARLKLADALLASAGLVGGGDAARVRAQERARRWKEAFHGIVRRGDSDAFVECFDRDLHLVWSSGATARGRHVLAAEVEGDLAAGVHLVPERVMSAEGVTVVEGRFVNPPESREHCPPGAAFVLFDADDRASRIHLHLAPRLPRLDDEG